MNFKGYKGVWQKPLCTSSPKCNPSSTHNTGWCRLQGQML